ncbi:MAG: endonuclease/exonuclease/phosphatase family protein, partial [Acidobacteria bacterium]|nr:endonuclease/exonuclease/phosphatase family protein [Acidobacteriota bacterium]
MNSYKIFSAIGDLIVSLLLKLPRAIFIWFLILCGSGYFGTLSWHFELASHFKLQYFAVSLVFATLFAVLRQWRWVAAALCCALVTGLSIIPWYLPKSSAQTPNSGQTIRLLLSNVLYTNSNYKAFVDLVQTEKPDLLFIQEVTPEWEKVLNGIRDTYPHGIIVPEEVVSGIAVISRLPLVKAADAGLGNYVGPTLEARVNIGGKLATIITAHSPTPGGKLNQDRRNEQFEVIANYMNGLPGPKILIGDLNVTMWSPYYSRFIERSGLVDARKGFGLLPTWSTFRPLVKIPIDHCLVSRDIRVV